MNFINELGIPEQNHNATNFQKYYEMRYQNTACGSPKGMFMRNASFQLNQHKMVFKQRGFGLGSVVVGGTGKIYGGGISYVQDEDNSSIQ